MPDSYSNVLSRRSFVAAGSGLSLVAIGLSSRSALAEPMKMKAMIPPGFPHQDPMLVQKVVLYSHFNIDAVRELINARPALAKSAWDWGFGDWESALGAASHMGNRAMAELLMQFGARPDIFTFTMLGNLPAVKAIVEAQPGIQRLAGPHGITLLKHARQGGDDAKEVVAYLEELGDADVGPTNKPLTAEQIAMYKGTYRINDSELGVFSIIESRGMIAFKYGEETKRNLMHQGDHEFHPGGSPEVRFLFDVFDGVTKSVLIIDAEAATRAMRVT